MASHAEALGSVGVEGDAFAVQRVVIGDESAADRVVFKPATRAVRPECQPASGYRHQLTITSDRIIRVAIPFQIRAIGCGSQPFCAVAPLSIGEVTHLDLHGTRSARGEASKGSI